MKQILLVDDHPSVMEGTKLMLEKEPDFHVTISLPEAGLMERIESGTFDILLFDLQMPGMNGIELSKNVLQSTPGACILIYTGFDMTPHFTQLLELGVSGFVSKTASQEQLVTSIRCALRGEAVIPLNLLKEIRRDVGAAGSVKKAANDMEQLTMREIEILQEVAKGKSNKEIAGGMHMSQRSLEYSLTQLFQKLNVRSRIEAVTKSKEMGILI